MWYWLSTRGQQRPEHTTTLSTFPQTDRWAKWIYIGVCAYVWILYVQVWDRKCVFVNILPCQVHFYSESLCWVSLHFNMKGESVILKKTQIYVLRLESIKAAVPTLVDVQCDSKVTEGQISSIQLILSQKQTSPSDPPTALASDLMFLGLLFFFFFHYERANKAVL